MFKIRKCLSLLSLRLIQRTWPASLHYWFFYAIVLKNLLQKSNFSLDIFNLWPNLEHCNSFTQDASTPSCGPFVRLLFWIQIWENISQWYLLHHKSKIFLPYSAITFSITLYFYFSLFLHLPWTVSVLCPHLIPYKFLHQSLFTMNVHGTYWQAQKIQLSLTIKASSLIFVSFIACCKFSEMRATRLYDCITKAAKYTVSFKMNGVVLGTM